MGVATSIKRYVLATAGVIGIIAIGTAVAGTLPAYHATKAAAVQQVALPPTGGISPGKLIRPIVSDPGWNPIFPPACDPTRESCIPPIDPTIPITCTGPVCRVRYSGESPQQTVARFAAAAECPDPTPPGGAPPPSKDKCPVVSLPGRVSPEEYELEAGHLPKFEGFVPYIYVDTTGNVTVGYGDNLTANGASSVTFYTQCASKTTRGGCICDATHACTVATAAQVAAEYNEIKDIGQPAACINPVAPDIGACWAPAHYKPHTSLMVSTLESFAWMSGKLDETTPQLSSIFPDFNTYPPQVRAALYDMIYNMGVGNYCTREHGEKVHRHCRDRGLLSYQRFIAAIKARNWMDAARESHRNGISRLRNEYVAGLLVAARYNETVCHAPPPIGPVGRGAPVERPPGGVPVRAAATMKVHSAGGKQ